MKLISRLEDEFHVTIKGREIMRLKSYSDGLKMIQRKLKEMEGAGQA
jgi:acyl carrier protein